MFIVYAQTKHARKGDYDYMFMLKTKHGEAFKRDILKRHINKLMVIVIPGKDKTMTVINT